MGKMPGDLRIVAVPSGAHDHWRSVNRRALAEMVRVDFMMEVEDG